jgi:hypothetical protein
LFAAWAKVSFVDPYSRFTTLTGQIRHDLEALLALVNQHQKVHPGSARGVVEDLKKIRKHWKQLRFPLEVKDRNKAYI